MSARSTAKSAPGAADALRASRTSGGVPSLDDGLAVPVLAAVLFTDDVLDALAERVAGRLAARQPQAQARWLTTQQAADYLAVPVSRVYRAVSMRASAKRPIPAHKDGARTFFLSTELDAWRRAGGAG
jgi:excisionase family DNA binding protein